MFDKGIIVGIEFSAESAFKESIYIATHDFHKVNESMDYCIMRERGQEVLTVRDEGLPYVAYCLDKGEVTILESNFDINSIEKENYVLFERRLSVHASALGIAPLLDAGMREILREWCGLLPETEIGRHVESMEQSEFIEKLDSGEIETPFFVKSVEKGAHGNTLALVYDENTSKHLIKTSERPDLDNGDGVGLYRYLSKSPDSLLTIYKESTTYFNEWHGEEERIPATYKSVDGKVMVSSVMNILSDEIKTLEHRAFIVNGKVSSVSRYVDYEQVQSPDGVIQYAKAFAERMLDILPVVYVADFAETDKGIELIEINPYENSGRYLWNDPVSLYVDVKALGNAKLTPSLNYSAIYQPEKRKPLFIFD